MIKSIEKLIKLHYFLLILFSIPTYGQNKIEIKQKIQSSLESFMSNLSYVNDEEEIIFPSTISAEFGGGNYFIFNGREMKFEHFIEDYSHSDLHRQIVNHTLVFTREGIEKINSDKADKRWSVNAILKREYASNPNIKIDDENINFIVSWNDRSQQISIIGISFQSKPRILNGIINNQEEKAPIVVEISQSDDNNINKDNKNNVFSHLKPEKNRGGLTILSSFEKRGSVGFGIYGNHSFLHYGIEAVFANTESDRDLYIDSDKFQKNFYELSSSITGETTVETEYIRPKAQLTITPGISLKYVSLGCGIGIFMSQKVVNKYVKGYYNYGEAKDQGNSNFFLMRPTITGHFSNWLSMSLGYNICPKAKPLNSFIFSIGFCFYNL